MLSVLNSTRVTPAARPAASKSAAVIAPRPNTSTTCAGPISVCRSISSTPCPSSTKCSGASRCVPVCIPPESVDTLATLPGPICDAQSSDSAGSAFSHVTIPGVTVRLMS